MIRLRIISHLEKGKSPNKIIDELLEFDSNLRLNYKLNLDQVNSVNDFLNVANGYGWDTKRILDIMLKIWNAGFNNTAYDGEKLSRLAEVLDALCTESSLEKITQIMEDLLEIKFYELIPQEKIIFMNINSDIKNNKINSKNFLKVGKSYVTTITNARYYLKGEITLDEVIRRINTS
jgi:hypothetical protein